MNPPFEYLDTPIHICIKWLIRKKVTMHFTAPEGLPATLFLAGRGMVKIATPYYSKLGGIEIREKVSDCSK